MGVQESRNISATILSGQTKSAAVSLAGFTLTGIITPAALDGTSLSFDVSADGSTFVPLYDSTNTAQTVTAGVSRGYALNPQVFMNWNQIKVVSNASESADHVITLVARPTA
jgi:hypothetical protein